MRKRIQATCPQWMVTMGDCMSLLVTFFVLLLTFSTIKEDQLMELIGVMNGALNVVDDVRMDHVDPDSDEINIEERKRMEMEKSQRGRYEERLVDPAKASPISLKSQKVTRHFSQFRERLRSLGFAHGVELEQLAEGAVLHLEMSVVFEPDSATIRADAWPILAAFADLANTMGNEIRLLSVQPPPGPQASDAAAWGRILARPQAIGEGLITRYGVPVQRLSYGVAALQEQERPYVDLVLVDAIHVLEVNVEDIVNSNTGDW